MTRSVLRPTALLGALLLLSISVCELVAQATMALPAQPQPTTKRDSVRTVLAALTSLRTLQYRLTLMESEAKNMLGFFRMGNAYCEINVADYCYGPKNGGLVVGGIGTYPTKRRYTMVRFRPVEEDRINKMITLYIDSVTSYLKRIPNELWLSNESVRLDLDRGYFVRAYETLRHCTSEPWWCAALRGHTMVMAGVRERADTVWDAVLAAMPEKERCAWLDPTWVSDDKKFNKAYRAASCADRIKIAQRAWWLSDPLYTVPGNERRAEHLARVVELMLGAGFRRVGAMNPAMMLRSKRLPTDSTVLAVLDPALQLKYAPWLLTYRWGFTEIVMRVGPPHYTARTDGGLMAALYPYPRVSFVPSGSVFLDHLHAHADDWSIHDPFAFEFVNGWFAPVRELNHQIAYFRRGDSVRIIAATDIKADSVFPESGLLKTLFLQRDFDKPATKSTGSGTGVVRFSLATVPESTLASIELVAKSGASGRVRLAVGPPPMPNQRVTLSDVLLVETRDTLARDLAQAESRALGTFRLAHGSTVTLFWETYGLAPGEKPRFAVVATRQRGSLLGGLLRAITSRSDIDSLSIVQEEAAVEGREIESRSVNLSLGTLAAGSYMLSVTVEVPGQQRVVSSRPLEILRARK